MHPGKGIDVLGDMLVHVFAIGVDARLLVEVRDDLLSDRDSHRAYEKERGKNAQEDELELAIGRKRPRSRRSHDRSPPCS